MLKQKNVAGGSHFKTWKIDFHFDFSWNLSARQTDKKTTQLLQGQKVTSLPALLCTNVYPSLKICAAEQIPCLHIATPRFWTVTYACNWVYIHGTRTPTKNWIFLSRWDYIAVGNGRKKVSWAQNSFSETDKMKKLNY